MYRTAHLPFLFRLSLWFRSAVLHRTPWIVVGDGHEIDCVPYRDGMTHTLGADCACGPRSELHEHPAGHHHLHVHHSLDGREIEQWAQVAR